MLPISTFVSKHAILWFSANFLVSVTGVVMTALAKLQPNQQGWFLFALSSTLCHASGNFIIGISLCLEAKRKERQRIEESNALVREWLRRHGGPPPGTGSETPPGDPKPPQ